MNIGYIKLKKTVKQEFVITEDDFYFILLEYYRLYPDKIEQLIKKLKIDNTTYFKNCPFPFLCNYFPCDRKYCSYDCLNNGNPGRSY